jgi:hypothetical protein
VPFDITTGLYSEANPVHPLDPSATPGVQAPTAIAPNADAREQGGVWDGTADFAAQADAGAADAAAAMSQAMDAKLGSMAHYQDPLLSLGGHTGDLMDIPVVPAAAVPPSDSFLYPFGGDEPTEESAGYDPGV